MAWPDVFKIIIAALGSVGIGGAIVFGLSNWLGRVWADRLLERTKAETLSAIESLKHELARAQFEHSVQFQNEFKIYRTLWKSLVRLRRAVGALRPIMDTIDPSESQNERKERRLNEVGDSFELVKQTVENNRPFYPESVYSAIRGLLDSAYEEAIDYKFSRDHSEPDYWKKAQANNKRISELTDAICLAIRDRIRVIELNAVNERGTSSPTDDKGQPQAFLKKTAHLFGKRGQ